MRRFRVPSSRLDKFFAAQFSAGYITSMSGFDLRQAQAENGVVHLRKVTIVRDLGKEVEINSGVKGGDQVILNPAVDLPDGSKVRLRQSTS